MFPCAAYHPIGHAHTLTLTDTSCGFTTGVSTTLICGVPTYLPTLGMYVLLMVKGEACGERSWGIHLGIYLGTYLLI